MKKYLFGTAVLILLVVDLSFAQGVKMGAPWSGRESSAQGLGRNNVYQLQQADIQFQMYDEQETFFALENAVAQNPYSANALLRRAKFKQLMGMSTEAVEDYRLAARLNPYAADLYGYTGPYSILNVLSIKPEESIEELEPAKKWAYYYNYIDQEYISGKTDMTELAMAEEVLIEIEESNLELAMDLVDRLLQYYPKSILGYDLKGLILTNQGKYAEAQEAFSKVVVLQPDFAITWYNFSRVHRELGEYDLALEYLDRAISLRENLTKAYFDRALVHKKMGDKESAIEDYNELIELKGEDLYAEAYLNRGLTKKMSGDFMGALEDLDNAIELFPQNAELYKNRGNLNLLFNYHNHALADFTKAIELDSEFAEAYYNRGLAHLILYDNVSGCFDLRKSEDLGYERATEKIRFFCVE